MTTSNSYNPADRKGDPDWDRVAAKFQDVFGYPPSGNQDVGKLLRDIRNVDPDWANAAYTFIKTMGVAPAGTADTATIARQTRAARVTYGDVSQAPARTGTGTVIPEGGKLIIVRNAAGADGSLYYYALPWRGVDMLYEIGTQERFVELFGQDVGATFDNVEVINQPTFDLRLDDNSILAGTIDQKLGQQESEASVIERDLRAAGMEDVPAWIGSNTHALMLVATATREEWSSGRLWQELSTTNAFKVRYGAVIEKYRQSGVTSIGDAVKQIEADEAALSSVLRPFLPPDGGFGKAMDFTNYLHEVMNQGWTAGLVAQVLEQAEFLERDPNRLATANYILEQHGLEALDAAGYINAINGVGPQETVEAINTATAANALEEAGIDLADEDLNLIMELVDTSDRLLTADSWKALSQELSLNLVRFNTELDQEKLGAAREDLIAAAFGQESPTGKSAGEVLSLLARFERDRRAAGAGFDQTTGFIDQTGRLRVQGQAGL